MERFSKLPRWLDTYTGERVVLLYLTAEDRWLVYPDVDGPTVAFCVDGDLWRERRFRRVSAGPYRQKRANLSESELAKRRVAVSLAHAKRQRKSSDGRLKPALRALLD